MITKLLNLLIDLFNTVIKHLPVKKTIVFESHPELTCNTYPIYKYLTEVKHINDTYKIVWFVEDKNKYKNVKIKNVKFINYLDTATKSIDKFTARYYLYSSKALVYSNRLLKKNRPDQFSFCLEHGMPLKKSNGGYCVRNNCSNCLCVSEFFADSLSEDFVVDKDKLVFAGFPRNDYIYTKKDVLSELGYNGYAKIIIWLPTYRKINIKSVEKFNIETTATGIPTINTPDEIRKIDRYCKEHNILLLLKPHPAQNISTEIQSELTNFRIITNDFLAEKNIQLYELMGKTDALITDYSSVYYDYLLCDKPIGLTVDDIEEYTKARGFVFDDPKEVLKGEYINNTDELISFFDDIIDGNDKHKTERNGIKNKIHTIQDGTSTQKVCNFILKNL